MYNIYFYLWVEIELYIPLMNLSTILFMTDSFWFLLLFENG